MEHGSKEVYTSDQNTPKPKTLGQKTPKSKTLEQKTPRNTRNSAVVRNFYNKRKILPKQYYEKQYSNERRARVIVIGCCMRSYAPFCDLPMKLQETYIRKIERSCYNSACSSADKKNVSRNWENPLFLHLYNMISYRVQKNIYWQEENTDSDCLIKKIVAGECRVENIGDMESRELQPLKTEDMYKEINKRRQQKIQKKYSTQHECFKCGGRRTTEVEVQLRSLDEGSTLFITCEMENCSNVWRISS